MPLGKGYKTQSGKCLSPGLRLHDGREATKTLLIPTPETFLLLQKSQTKDCNLVMYV